MRHAATGTSRIALPSACTDTSAPRPARSDTCASLAGDDDAVLSFLDRLNAARADAVTAIAGSELSAAVKALIAVLGAAVLLLLFGLAYALSAKKKSPEQADKV